MLHSNQPVHHSDLKSLSKNSHDTCNDTLSSSEVSDTNSYISSTSTISDSPRSYFISPYVTLIIPTACIPIILIYDVNVVLSLSLSFISFFIISWNFPIMTKSLYERPLYIGDIQNTRFEISYINIMNVILSIACAFLFDNFIIREQIYNKSLLEITGLLGGNITFFASIQNYFAKFLLSVCHKCKLHDEEAKSRRNSTDDTDTSIPSPSTQACIVLADNQLTTNHTSPNDVNTQY